MLNRKNVGWTVQSPNGYIEDFGDLGQTFTEDELPHPDVQRASGIDPDLYRKGHGLVVDPAVAPRAQFVSTETGYAPHQVIEKTGNVESFRSFPAGVEVPEEYLAEDHEVRTEAVEEKNEDSSNE
jgi:hypothetical protein